MNPPSSPFWNQPVEDLLRELEASSQGLAEAEARQRLKSYGFNRLKLPQKSNALALLIGQFKNPIVLILISAAGLSLYLKDSVDALIILTIVLISGLLGYWQERGASQAVKKLLEVVQIKAAVLREGTVQEISIEEIVPGDIIQLHAGDVIRQHECALFRQNRNPDRRKGQRPFGPGLGRPG